MGSTWILAFLPLVELQPPPPTAEYVFAKSLAIAYCVTKVI